MDYTTFTKPQLVAECKKLGITGYSSKKKDEILSMLLELTTTTIRDLENEVVSVSCNKKEKKSHSKKENEPEPNSFPKPVIKWVGGKTQIIDQILNNMPRDMNNYREIFLGGGSVLLALLHSVRMGEISVRGNIYAYDLNEPLIYLYKNIQARCDEVYQEIQRFINEFSDCRNETLNRTPANFEEATGSKENYYYWIRTCYNSLTPCEKKTPIGSAMFVFLNKTCFRGVFRVGPNGFNVPYGNYTNPEIINREHLEDIRDLIQPVIFECCDFSTSLEKCESGDYLYLDPPYAPETETSFVGYTLNGFSKEKHKLLFETIHKLTYSSTIPEIKMTMSNSDVPFVRDEFTKEKYNIMSVMCKRSINSKNPEAKTREVIINNY
jgi:DNA adenine methylase